MVVEKVYQTPVSWNQIETSGASMGQDEDNSDGSILRESTDCYRDESTPRLYHDAEGAIADISAAERLRHFRKKSDEIEARYENFTPKRAVTTAPVAHTIELPPQPIYCRKARDDEIYVMEKFASHAQRCYQCASPSEVHLRGRALCDRGHQYAIDVAQYIYSRAGKACSLIDRESGRPVQVTIPKGCEVILDLLKAMERGLKLRRKAPAVSYDQNYQVRPRPVERQVEHSKLTQTVTPGWKTETRYLGTADEVVYEVVRPKASKARSKDLSSSARVELGPSSPAKLPKPGKMIRTLQPNRNPQKQALDSLMGIGNDSSEDDSTAKNTMSEPLAAIANVIQSPPDEIQVDGHAQTRPATMTNFDPVERTIEPSLTNTSTVTSPESRQMPAFEISELTGEPNEVAAGPALEKPLASGLDLQSENNNFQGESAAQLSGTLDDADCSASLSGILSRLMLVPREPPLASGLTRIRWTCRCGKRMYDDYKDIVPGAARYLEHYLNKSYKQAASNGNRVRGSRHGLREVAQRINSTVKRVVGRSSNASDNGLPMSRIQAQAEPLSSSLTPSRESLFLLLCVNIGTKKAPTLLQENAYNIASDQHFFTILRHKVAQARSQLKSFLSLRTIHQINFVQFEVFTRDLTDIRKAPAYPPLSLCSDYTPCYGDDLATDPPVGSNLMIHLFENPHDADATLPVLLNRIPKKRKTRLFICQVKRCATGWGLQLVEGTHWMKLWCLTFAGLILSMSFGVVWSSLMHDIQGGFAVTSCAMVFFTTVGGMLHRI